jgi:hypothetical protein
MRQLLKYRRKTIKQEKDCLRGRRTPREIEIAQSRNNFSLFKNISKE